MNSRTRPSGNSQNIGQTFTCSATEEFAAYDRLPAWARELFANSPFNLSAAGFEPQYRQFKAQGVPDIHLRAEFHRLLRQTLHRAAFETYGPDHPQA